MLVGHGVSGKSNPRFVVTSLVAEAHAAQPLYEEIYCARGDMENRIKEQMSLFAERVSTESMRGNQLRLYFSVMAYVLVTGLLSRDTKPGSSSLSLHGQFYQPGPQQLDACPPVHLPFDRLQSIHLALHRTIAPGLGDGCFDRLHVSLESIYQQRERGVEPRRAAFEGTRMVLIAVLASTLTSIIIFVPLVFGKQTQYSVWLGDTGASIMISLVCSLFVSVTCIPLYASRYLEVPLAQQEGEVKVGRMGRFSEWYGRMSSLA